MGEWGYGNIAGILPWVGKGGKVFCQYDSGNGNDNADAHYTNQQFIVPLDCRVSIYDVFHLRIRLSDVLFEACYFILFACAGIDGII